MTSHSNGYLRLIKFKLACLLLIVAKTKKQMLVPIQRTRPFSKRMLTKNICKRYKITGLPVSHCSKVDKRKKIYMLSHKACARAVSTLTVVHLILQQHSSEDRFTIVSTMTRILSDASTKSISIMCKDADTDSSLKTTCKS